MNWEKCRQRGKSLQAALVIGPIPTVGYVATAKFLYDVDEYTIAGGIAGEPVELVRCKTVDIEVPATAEIVIEGQIPTDSMESEAPFGEYTGYMGTETISPYFNVTCITHRRNPIYVAFLSQKTPSEGNVISSRARASAVYKFLRYDCGLPVLDVVFHQSCGMVKYCVIRLRKAQPTQAWQVLYAAAAYEPGTKTIIGVDEDIDPRDADSVNWALSWRMLPDRDVRIIQGRIAPMDYSVYPPGEPQQPSLTGSSALLIDATRKWGYPPQSLPRKEFMEKAKKIWEEEGLPPLRPKMPCYGYPLGYWSEELEEEAELALKGEHYKTGDKLARERVKL